MKNLLLYMLLVSVAVSCNINKPAEFIGIENVRIESSDNREVVLLADAKYRNPNHLGGQVKSVNIHVFVEGNEVAQMQSTKDFVIPKREEFTIPLKTTIPWNSLTKNKDLLGSIFDVALSKEITIVMKGDMKIDFKVMNYTYKIEETKNVHIK